MSAYDDYQATGDSSGYGGGWDSSTTVIPDQTISDPGSSNWDGFLSGFKGNTSPSDSGWASTLGTVARTVLPNLVAGAMTKGATSRAAQLTQMASDEAKKRNQFADLLYGQYQNKYIPMSNYIGDRAMSIGTNNDMNEAAGIASSDVMGALQRARAQATTDLARYGLDPSSGAYQARMGVIDAGAAPSLVSAMTTARRDREQYGDQMRQQALANYGNQPSYGSSGSLAISATAGAADQQKAYASNVNDLLATIADANGWGKQ